MKSLALSTLVFFIESFCSANDTIEVQTRFWRHANGERAYVSEWFSGVNLALFNLGLKTEKLHGQIADQGLDIGSAEKIELLSPELPEDCQIHQASGIYSRDRESSQVVSFVLKGKNCESLIEELDDQPIVMEMKKVRHAHGQQGQVQLLRLVVSNQ